jgi:hypothetical protein
MKILIFYTNTFAENVVKNTLSARHMDLQLFQFDGDG